MSKLASLRIQNFLSIRDVEVVFAESGVWHVRGPNNVGKSALLNAINILYNNAGQQEYKSFLRDGARTFKLTGRFHDQSQVILSRGATDYYEWTINGETGRVNKTKGTVPPVLQQYYRLYTDRERTKECLNIRLPRAVLTFVDTTKSENNLLVQKALGTEESLLASQRAETRKREIVAEQRQLNNYLEMNRENAREVERALTEKLELQQQQQAIMDRIEEEYQIFQVIEAIVEKAEALARYDEQIHELTRGVNLEELASLQKEIQILESLTTLQQLLINEQACEQSAMQLSAEVTMLSAIQQETLQFEQLTRTFNAALDYQDAKLATNQREQDVREVDERYQDFMRENKFCPIVMNSLDQRCPFGAELVTN